MLVRAMALRHRSNRQRIKGAWPSWRTKKCCCDATGLLTSRRTPFSGQYDGIRGAPKR
jgi:hypothetical protein